MRVGIGYDVHRFSEHRQLVLCGVVIQGHAGLDGHSDADVALHAVADAILGAAGKGDIGQHFPPGDERWRGAASEVIVRGCLEMIEGNWLVENVDLTIVAESPRIGPYRDAMRQRLAEMLGVEVVRVNIKATTNETMGFVGRREGIATLATVLLSPRYQADLGSRGR